MILAMPKTNLLFITLCWLAGFVPLTAQNTDCARLLREAADFEKNKQYDRALKKYLSAKEECDAATSAEVNRKVLAVFEKIEQQRLEAESAKRQAEANAARALNAERTTLLEKQKAERSSEANRLAALALSKATENPTLGRHLAAMAWEKSLDSTGQYCMEPGVATVMHSIASAPDAWMYRPFKAHTGRVYDIAFSPDGTTLITCGTDSTMRLWGLDGKQRWAAPIHAQTRGDAVFSPNGRYIVSKGQDSIYLLDSDNGALLKIFDRQKGMLGQPVFSPDNKHLLIVHDTCTVWDIETGDVVRKFSNSFLEKKTFKGSYSPDGSLILLGGYSNSGYPNFVLVDTLGRTIDTLWGKKTHASEVQFTPDGSKLIISKSQFLFLKDIKTGQLDSIKMLYSGYKLAISEKNRQIAIFQYSELILIDYVNLTTTNLPLTYTDLGYGIAKIVFVQNGRVVVISSHSGNIGFYDIERKTFSQFRIHDRSSSIVTTPKGNVLASVGDGGEVLLWQKNMAPAKVASFLKISPDGERIAAGEYENARVSIQILDSATNLVATLHAPFYYPIQSDDIHFLSKSKQLLVHCADSTIRIWDYDGNLKHTFRADELATGTVLISPMGGRILSVNNKGNALIWDDKGEKVGVSDAKTNARYNNMYSAKFSPDGSDFYIQGDTSTYLFDKNGVLAAQINGLFSSIGFSPFGHIWTIADYPDYRLKVWDKRGKLLVDAPKSYLYSFSLDGQQLAIANDNQQITVWDMPTQRSKRWTAPANIERLAYGSNGLLYATANAYPNHITYILDSNGREAGRYSGSLPIRSSNFLFPDGRVLSYKFKSGKCEYLQVFDRHYRVSQILEGLSNLEGHDISADGRFKLAWSRDKIIVWDNNGRPLRTFSGAANNVNKAYFTPDSRYIVEESDWGRTILWDNPATYISQSKVLSVSDLLKAGAGISTDSVLASNDPDILAEAADFYFYDRNEPNEAEAFYERLETTRHTPRALTHLHDIAQQTGRPFDNRRFLQSNNFTELNYYGDFLLNKKQWSDARAVYEKAIAVQANAHSLFQLNVIADTLRQPFDMSRFDVLANEPNGLSQAAYMYYVAEKWGPSKHLYEMVERKQHRTDNLLQLYRISEKTGQEPPEFNRYLSSEDAYELEQYGNFFFNARQWSKAQLLLEKASRIQPTSFVLHRLQIIADSLGQTVDFEQFMLLKNTDEVLNSADFFYDRREWEKAKRLYDKAGSIGVLPNAYTFARMVALAARTSTALDMEKIKRLNQTSDNYFWIDATLEAQFYAKDTTLSHEELLNFLAVLRQLEDELFAIDTSARVRRQVASRYTSIAWQHLFTRRESHAKAVELASRRGLEIVPDETTVENKVLKTNMPTSLVLQGRFEEAWRDWYEPLKERAYGRNNYPTFRDVFLGDIKILEEAGVKHPDFEKVKTRLNAADR